MELMYSPVWPVSSHLLPKKVLPKRGQLPASAFAKDVDNTGEALAAVVPVCLQAPLDAVGIAVCQGPDDVIVFGDGELKVACDRAGIQTPVAFGLRFDGAMPGA